MQYLSLPFTCAVKLNLSSMLKAMRGRIYHVLRGHGQKTVGPRLASSDKHHRYYLGLKSQLHDEDQYLILKGRPCPTSRRSQLSIMEDDLGVFFWSCSTLVVGCLRRMSVAAAHRSCLETWKLLTLVMLLNGPIFMIF